MGDHDHLMNRVQFKYEIEPGTKPGKDPAWHELTAHFTGKPDFTLGSLTWNGTKGHEISNIGVDEGYQRHGIATAMYKHAKKLDPQISHSPVRTPDGERWSKSLNEPRPPRKWDENG